MTILSIDLDAGRNGIVAFVKFVSNGAVVLDPF